MRQLEHDCTGTSGVSGVGPPKNAALKAFRSTPFGMPISPTVDGTILTREVCEDRQKGQRDGSGERLPAHLKSCMHYHKIMRAIAPAREASRRYRAGGGQWRGLYLVRRGARAAQIVRLRADPGSWL